MANQDGNNFQPKSGKKIDQYQTCVDSTQIHAPISKLIGMRFTHIAPGNSRFELEIRPDHLNSLGSLQGGVLAIMADASMGAAFGSQLEMSQNFTTLELKMNFIKATASGHLISIGTVIHQGKRTGMTECSIFLGDPSEKKLIAKATSTLMIL